MSEIKHDKHSIINNPLCIDNWSTCFLGSHVINVQDSYFLNMNDVANNLFGRGRWVSDDNLYVNREGHTVLIWETQVANTFRVECAKKEMNYLMKRRGVGK